MLLLNAKSANERKAIVSKQISEDICFIEQDKQKVAIKVKRDTGNKRRLTV